jgi:hypothetical protein
MNRFVALFALFFGLAASAKAQQVPAYWQRIESPHLENLQRLLDRVYGDDLTLAQMDGAELPHSEHDTITYVSSYGLHTEAQLSALRTMVGMLLDVRNPNDHHDARSPLQGYLDNQCRPFTEREIEAVTKASTESTVPAVSQTVLKLKDDMRETLMEFDSLSRDLELEGK